MPVGARARHLATGSACGIPYATEFGFSADGFQPYPGRLATLRSARSGAARSGQIHTPAGEQKGGSAYGLAP